jgi:hypothetical protein
MAGDTRGGVIAGEDGVVKQEPSKIDFLRRGRVVDRFGR